MSNNNDKTKWSWGDTQWMLSLFGTAVGAGVLFLPIRAGLGGFWPIVVMAALIFPMTWLSHRALSRFVLSSSKENADITEVVEEHFGKGFGKLVTLLYFFAIYPICLAYGVGITNTVDSFLVNQLGIVGVSRPILAIVLITLMMIVMVYGKDIVLKVTSALVFPLSGVLLLLSLYLIPQWKVDAIQSMPPLSEFVKVVWLTIPVLVFAFNHSPAISSFSVDMNQKYAKFGPEKSNQILFRTSAMLLTFVMLFVISCIFTLTPAQLVDARNQNISILSYFANINPGDMFISYAGPLIAFTAITSSFFGHYFGAHEGLNGIILKQAKTMGFNPNVKSVDRFTMLFIYVTMIIVAIINPSVLGFIEDLGGPIIAVILFLMPMYAISKVPSMRKYSNAIADGFIVIMGIIAITSVVYKLF